MRATIVVISVAVVAYFVLGFAVVSALLPEQTRAGIEIRQAEYGDRWPFRTAEGWLRCEGAGAIILNVRGKDYAVNGMAGSRYAPMQRFGIRASTSAPLSHADWHYVSGSGPVRWLLWR